MFLVMMTRMLFMMTMMRHSNNSYMRLSHMMHVMILGLVRRFNVMMLWLMMVMGSLDFFHVL
jgi:hypothetical protein